MRPLPRTRTLQTVTTTSVTAPAFHISEAEPKPLEWGFSGYSPDRAFYDRLNAYGELNRRFYLIDHRNRAWIVTFAQVVMTPRKRQKLDDGTYNDWAADYEVTAYVYNQDPKTPS